MVAAFGLAFLSFCFLCLTFFPQQTKEQRAGEFLVDEVETAEARPSPLSTVHVGAS